MSNASNKIYKELVPRYTNFSDFKSENFKGFKVVVKTNGNYYSVVSGLFRYKPRRVSQNSYHTLYYGTEHYRPELIDKVGIFVNKDDAVKALESYDISEHGQNSELVVVSVELSGELISCDYTNRSVDSVPVVLGTIIDSVKEVGLCQ